MLLKNRSLFIKNMAGRNCCKCVTVSLVPTASLILVILFVCGIILLPILYVELAHDYKYGIIIDAGSSHTTLYGYRWRVPTKNNSTGVIEVKEAFQCIKKRSLNSFASKPNDSYRAIQHCLTESQNYRNLQIEDKQYQYVPIFLGATAGMRVLNMINPTASDEILAEIRHTLEDSGYNFKDARIISGVEEAVGGWTTTNYLDKNLNPPKESTIGSLDLGGASTQIAFQVFDQPPGHKPSEKLFSQQYNLFARSYLCYGVNEARGRFLAHLVNAAGKSINVSNTSVPDPCLATGTNVTYHHNDIYTGCVIGLAAIEAFGFSIAPPTSLVADGDVNFIGKWDVTECRNIITDVFNFSKCKPDSNCPDGKNFTLPPVNGSFTAFSAFYYTADYFASSNTTVNRENGWEGIRTAVNNSCIKNRKNSTDDCIVNGTVKRFCYQHCFNGLFMAYLLESGYGFNKAAPNEWSVEFKEKLGDVSVGWALGYMLNQTSHIPQDHFVNYRPYTAVDLVVGILILTILCAVFVIFFLLTFYACRKALRPRNGFQPL